VRCGRVSLLSFGVCRLCKRCRTEARLRQEIRGKRAGGWASCCRRPPTWRSAACEQLPPPPPPPLLLLLLLPLLLLFLLLLLLLLLLLPWVGLRLLRLAGGSACRACRLAAHQAMR
jgi:hypothetical protein